MKNFLPIGSVVELENGKAQLMIVNRFPLYNENGKIGYYDYSACLYPQGNINNEYYFFNSENIKTILFEGYKSEQEVALQQRFYEEEKNITYPKFHIK